MAESSKDLESGSDRLKSPLLSEKEASPDKRLVYFAFKLALLEKAASTLGTLNFIWATAVLLGGFLESLTITSQDYWVVTYILVVESLRILCRWGELATRRSWSSGYWLTKLIYYYSLFIQEYSATLCIMGSSIRIKRQQYGSDGNLNRKRAFNLFYSLSLVESSLSLLGFLVRFVFSRSSCFECGLDIKSDEYNFDMVRHFFDEAYSRCINGSVFDGLKMDFVSYSMELLLQSIDDNEQLRMGAQLLLALLKSDQLPSKKLRAIETKPGVLERLIELLNWEKPPEQEIRTVAAQIISKLLEFPRNRIRVIAFPESMESIQSLLYDENQKQVHLMKYQGQSSDEYNYQYLNELGLWILKILANDPDNWAKLKTNEVLLRQIKEVAGLRSDLPESEILKHLKSLSRPASPVGSLSRPASAVGSLPRPASPGRQRNDRENINATSGSEAEHSDHQNLQTVDSQV